MFCKIIIEFLRCCQFCNLKNNSVIKTNMVSTRKKRQSNRRLLSQLDDFDQDMIIGNAASERQENTVVNEGTNDRDFTVGTSNDSSIVNGNAMSVKTL